MVEMVIPTIETATKLVLMMLIYLIRILSDLNHFKRKPILSSQTSVRLLDEVPHELLIFCKFSGSEILFLVLFKLFTCLFHLLHNAVSSCEKFFTEMLKYFCSSFNLTRDKFTCNMILCRSNQPSNTPGHCYEIFSG